MIKIKLIRKGKRNSPTYRIAIQEAKQKLSGSVIQELGYFIPKEGKNTGANINKVLYDEWIKKGATPTKGVLDLISGTYSYKKYSPKTKSENKEEPKEEVKKDDLDKKPDGEN